MASDIDTGSSKREGSAIERLLARWENKVEFVVTQAEFALSAANDKSNVNERGELVMQVQTYTAEAAAKYSRGEIRVVPFQGAHDRDSAGEPIIGAIKCNEGHLQIGVLLNKGSISDLVASGVCAAHSSGPRLYIALWLSSKLPSWNGEGQLWVKEATFVIRSSDQARAT